MINPHIEGFLKGKMFGKKEKSEEVLKEKPACSKCQGAGYDSETERQCSECNGAGN